MEARELRIGNHISYCGEPRIVELVSELKGIHAVNYLGSHKSAGVSFDFDPIDFLDKLPRHQSTINIDQIIRFS